MSQFFLENAHNRIDPKKFGEGWEHVFGKKCTHKTTYIVDELTDPNAETKCLECNEIIKPVTGETK